MIVGNEVLLRGDRTVDQLIEYIRYVKAHVKQPVTYADVWEWWLKYPQVADEVDFITIHLLPYWEDVPTSVEDAEERILEAYKTIRERFPGKPILVGEVGWPTAGRTRGPAETGLVNKARFINQFVRMAEREGFQYNIVEAFDQGWKSANEGTVGANWGLFSTDRERKFSLAGPVVENPYWVRHFALSSGLAVLAVLVAAATTPGLISRLRPGRAILLARAGPGHGERPGAGGPCRLDRNLLHVRDDPRRPAVRAGSGAGGGHPRIGGASADRPVPQKPRPARQPGRRRRHPDGGRRRRGDAAAGVRRALPRLPRSRLSGAGAGPAGARADPDGVAGRRLGALHAVWRADRPAGRSDAGAGCFRTAAIPAGLAKVAPSAMAFTVLLLLGAAGIVIREGVANTEALQWAGLLVLTAIPSVRRFCWPAAAFPSPMAFYQHLINHIKTRARRPCPSSYGGQEGAGMPRWVSSIPARLTAAAFALGCTASSRAEPVVDINSAVAAAGQQTRAVIARLNDLHASHAGGAPNGGIRTERLRLELDEKQVPLRAFSRFMPSMLKEERTGPIGSFFSGSARLAQKAGRHQNGETYLETPGLTAGADMQVGQHSSIGVAGGYIATAEKLSGRSLAVYGAHMLKPGLTFDAVAGTGDLSFSAPKGRKAAPTRAACCSAASGCGRKRGSATACCSRP